MLCVVVGAMAYVAGPRFIAPTATRATLSIAMQHGGKGFGGGEATRDPEPTIVDPNDPKGKQQAIHKAESFADYLAKRGGGDDAAAPAAAGASAPAAAGASAPAATGASAAPAASSSGCSDIVTSWEPAALSKVASTLELTASAGYAGFDSFTMAGATGKIESYEGPGLPNVAWCSGLQLCGETTARSSVTAFCGPLTDVSATIFERARACVLAESNHF